MGNIFYIMGKSASGKDTLYNRLLEDQSLKLKTIVLYTTRPIREGEEDGKTYHFSDEAGFKRLLESGKVIEYRSYDTVHGIWTYFTVADEHLCPDKEDYLMIGTLESYCRMKEYFGAGVMVPLYIELEDGERLSRALGRERQQKEPKYAELCRRFLADAADFSEENIRAAEIGERFENRDLEQCLEALKTRIRSGQVS